MCSEQDSIRCLAAMRHMYCHRSLCEARDNAFSERDRAISAEREMNSKNEQLMKE